MAPRRIRDRRTGETFVMPWDRPDEPTAADINLYKQQKAQDDNSWPSWGKRTLSNALTAGKDAAMEVAGTAAEQMGEFGGGALEIGKGAAQMLNPFPFERSDPNDPSTDPLGVGWNTTSPGQRMAQGIVGSVQRAGQDIEGARQDIVERGDEPWSTAGMGALHAGLDLGEITGIPFRSAWDEAANGHWSRAGGMMVAGAGLYAAAKGAHGGELGRYGTDRITDPSRLLPAAGETSARFYGGEAGMADATQPYTAPPGDLANPYWGPEDLRPDQPVSPLDAAQGGPPLPRVNRTGGPAVDTLDPNTVHDVAPPEPAGQGRISVEGLGQEQPAAVGEIQPPEMPYQPSSPVGNQLVQGFQEGRVPPVEPVAPEGPLPTDWSSQGMQVPDVTNPMEPPVPEPVVAPQPVPEPPPVPVLPQVRRGEGPRLEATPQAPAPAEQMLPSAPIKPRRFGPGAIEDAVIPDVENPDAPVEAQPVENPAAKLAQIMAEKKAAAEAKPIGKGARVKAIVDQIATKPGGIQTVLGNESAIAELAKNAGVHPESLRQALNRTAKEQVKAAKAQAAAPAAPPPAAAAPVAETPAVAPKKVAGATPDRVLRLARGTHDPVRVTFPDKLHADLFSALGRLRRNTRGEPGIQPDFKGLAKQFGVDEKTVVKIATEYRKQVLEAAKAMPKTAEGGVVEMKAPSISDLSTPADTAPKPATVKTTTPKAPKGGRIGAISEAPKKAPAAGDISALDDMSGVRPNDLLDDQGPHPNPTTRDEFNAQGQFLTRKLDDIRQVNPDKMPHKIPEYRIVKKQLQALSDEMDKKFPVTGEGADLARLGDSIKAGQSKEAGPLWEDPKLSDATIPKVKQSVKGVKTDTRIQAKIDEMSGAEVENLLHDKVALSHAASEAGVKPSALRAALKRLVQEDEGSVDYKKTGQSLKEFHQKLMQSIKDGMPDAREQGELDQAITRIYKEMNPEKRLDPKNARAKKALDLLKAIRIKNPESPTGKVMLRGVASDVIEASRKIRDATYGKLKMEKEDIVNHYLDTGKVELPDTNIDMSDAHLSQVQDFFRKIGGSEKGALSLPTKAQMKAGALKVGKLGGKAFDATNVVRMTEMLSGLAVPKSLLGNVGAHLIAALEGKTLKPIQVAFQVRNILSDIKTGLTTGANPAQTGGFGGINVFGRVMGAADHAAVESLKRAGLTEEAARELTLTNANTISKWKPLNTRLGRVLVPFRTIASNQFEQGLLRWQKHPVVYAGAIAVGAMAGAKIKDKEALALASAMAGPYALPFLFGASLVQGAGALEGISPIPEWGITKTLTDPFSAFVHPPGRRWFRSNLGFGATAAREKRLEMGKRVSAGGGRGRSGR